MSNGQTHAYNPKLNIEKNVVKKILPLVIALLQGIKNLFGPLLMTWTADSPTRRYGESATPRLANAGSRRLLDSPIRGVNFILQISPRIRSQNRNSSKASVQDLC
jgi:hypothetical protein